MEYKVCKHCLETKSLDNFRSDCSRSDGLARLCKPCNRENDRRRYRENRSARIANQQRHLKKNRQAINQRQLRHYWANRSTRIKQHRDWYYRNREEQIAKQLPRSNKRRALKRMAGVFVITRKELNNLRRKPCYLCGAKSEHIDHVIPLARGGRHSIGNLAPSCANCNHRKGTKYLVELKIKDLQLRTPLLYGEQEITQLQEKGQ